MPSVNSLGQGPHDRREWPRYLAHHDVELTIKVGDQNHRCQVRDISLGGARLYCEDDLPDAAEIVFDHPVSGPVVAERLWRAKTEIGIQFDFSEAALTLISQCLSTMLDLNAPQPAVA